MIVPVVEGKKSETQSIPLLLRRVIEHTFTGITVQISKPIFLPRGKFTKDSELKRVVELAIRTRESTRALLFIFDADDDAPCAVGPNVLSLASKHTHLPVGVVVAVRETESWFLGAKESLRGVRGISSQAAAPANPESVANPKGELTRNMTGGRRYLDVDDQPALATKMDIDMARRNCPSFDKLVREVERLVREMQQPPAQ